MADFLPRASAAAVDSTGRFTRETYDALRRAFDSLSSRQTELETAQAAITAILGSLGAASVEELQDLGNLLDGKQDASEVLDALSDILSDGIVVKHGPTAYGRSMGDSATIEWANASGAAGNPTPSLKDLADSGAGTFKLLTRDAKGRLSGTANGTTSHVPEGSNLYHTTARARAAAVADTITDGVLDVAPSQNAVFDALVLKGGLADANSWTGTNTFGQQATFNQIGGGTETVFSRTNSTANCSNRFTTTDSTVFFGIGTSGVFSVGSNANLASGSFRWCYFTASELSPGADNTISSGSASRKYSAVHAVNGVIGPQSPSLGGGAGVSFLGNATTVPTSNPTAGSITYCEAGATKVRGSSGTITTTAPA